MRSSAPPFLPAPRDAVRFTVPWQLQRGTGPVLLADDVPAWDYQATIALAAVLDVDVEAVRAACHLGHGSELHVVVTASSSATKMRGPVAVASAEGGPVQLDVELMGHELGGRLLLDTVLVVSHVERTDALSPRAPGSILWRHPKSTWLEGESARFPTEVADLAAAPFFTPGALWFLDIRTDDLDTAALGSVRLVLNESHPLVTRLLAGDTSPETALTMSALRWDIARQLITTALESEEFVERDGIFDDETLGAMLAGVLAMHWPGESPRSLRQLRVVEPARFERELQDRSGLLRD
jgi:hypothetical protein